MPCCQILTANCLVVMPKAFRQRENLDNATIALRVATMGKDIRPYILHTSITTVTLEHKYYSTAYSSDMNALAKRGNNSVNEQGQRQTQWLITSAVCYCNRLRKIF